MTIFCKYFILLISFTIFGRASPFNSEYSDGKMRVMGLNFENSKISFSIFSLVLSEKL
tara:strand:+ start:1177 stop:1350 length:174 start_codon:yes stop_codon:yes gene_type:complete